MKESFMPEDRDMSTGARCALVADILELHPERHNQAEWVEMEFFDGGLANPEKVAEAGTCGSAGCAAGWAVAATPASTVKHLRHVDGVWGWTDLGALVLGIHVGDAEELFAPYNERDVMVEALRFLADQPEGDRSLNGFYRYDELGRH